MQKVRGRFATGRFRGNRKDIKFCDGPKINRKHFSMKKLFVGCAVLAVVFSCNSSPDYTGNYSGTVDVVTTTIFRTGDSTVVYSTEPINGMIYKKKRKLRIQCAWAECSCLMCVPPPIEFVGTTANYTCGGGLYAPLTVSKFEVSEGSLSVTISQMSQSIWDTSAVQKYIVRYAGTLPKN